MEDTTDDPLRELSTDDRAAIVLSVLSGREVPAPLAGRRERVPEPVLEGWRETFVEGGLLGLQGTGGQRVPARESLLLAEVTELKTALGEVCLELNVWQAIGKYARRAPDG